MRQTLLAISAMVLFGPDTGRGVGSVLTVGRSNIFYKILT
jgi:hypothetical protein